MTTNNLKQSAEQPIPMILYCPNCGKQHIDAPKACDMGVGCYIAGKCFAEIHGEPQRCPRWDNPPHRSHLCADCGTIWRPADVPTTGVAAITTKGTADDWIVESQTRRAAPVRVTKKL